MSGRITRRTFVAAAAAASAGCGGERSGNATASASNPAIGAVEQTGELRKFEEKAPSFTAGMNPTNDT